MHTTRGLLQSEGICADMAETYKNTPIITLEFDILVCGVCICAVCACD